MKIWQDEIFAPVLSIVRVKDLEEGIKLTNQSKFANGAVIYTSNGKHAQTFRDNIDLRYDWCKRKRSEHQWHSSHLQEIKLHSLVI